MPTAGDPQDIDRDKSRTTTGTTGGNTNKNNNLFIRFKDHVDFNVHRGYEIFSSLLWTLPSTIDSFSHSHDKGGATQNQNHNSSSSPSSSSSPPVLSNRDRSPTSTPSPSSSTSPALTGLELQRLYEHYDDVEDITDVDSVYNWAVNSDYSPLNLQNLRQPVPRDAPHYYHFSFTFPPWSSTTSTPSPSSFSSPRSSSSSSSSSSSDPQFTFRDAFEDLLFVNAGYPLPDLRGRLFGRVFEEFPLHRWQRTPSSSPSSPSSSSIGPSPYDGLHVADWTARLGYLGLWHSYFPQLAAARPSSLTVTAAERRVGRLSDDPWLAARRRLLAAIESAATGDDEDAPLINGELAFRPTASTGITFGGWDKVWDWGWNGKGSESSEWPKDVFGGDEDEAPSKVRDGGNSSTMSSASPQPDVEEDLYGSLAITDFQASGEEEDHQRQQPKALTTTTSEKDQQQATDTETIDTTEHADGGKTVCTVRRHEDRSNGRTEVRTTIEQYDAEGNVISRSKSTRSSRSWSSSFSSGSDSGSGGESPRWNGSLFGSSSRSSSAWTMGGGGGNDRGKDENRDEVDTTENAGQREGNGDRKKGGWFWTK